MTLKLPVELRDEIRALPCWPHDYELHDEDAIELIVRHCVQLYALWLSQPPEVTFAQFLLAAFGLDEKEGT